MHELAGCVIDEDQQCAGLDPLQVALTHLHPAQSITPNPLAGMSSYTLALQSYDIIALRLQQLGSEY